tara:strand:+ start:2482 stop:4743 length:2262 start_codon:yes stop_codon:yes gene_type:complete
VEDSQRENQNDAILYRVLKDVVPKGVLQQKNKAKTWGYGYNEKYDIIVISKNGTIGDVYLISGLRIALPSTPKEIHKRSGKKAEQYWEVEEFPVELKRIQSIFHWDDMPPNFKDRWVEYIEDKFEKRDLGMWFMNNGVPTYITGGHYQYLQWSKIDVGLPDFREANRVLYIHWEACMADSRSFGQCYLKIRRSGFSFMGSSEASHTATLAKDARVGILSKTGADAKKMFTDKVVPISHNYPFFFKPIQDGMDKPKTELSYRVPASKITKRNMHDSTEAPMQGLDTTIDWKNTADNSYDGEKLLLLIHDESGKWLPPDNILNNWRVTKTCLRLGRKIIGKCMMGSTCNALNKGGANFKRLYNDSSALNKNKNGQTTSGLYSLFIPMELNMEGFIDLYGHPVIRTPKVPVMGIDNAMITMGAIDYWENEAESLKHDPDALNEFYRQFPRTESHAFRDESKQSLFNLTKIYQQIDFNDGTIMSHNLTRGRFSWKDGVKDTKVIWTPDRRGRFLMSWIPPTDLQNNIEYKMGNKHPGNAHMGAFGCDSYDISGTVGGGGSNGALHGQTCFHMDNGPTNEFFLEYIARPQTAELFFEDVLMAIVFCGMPILVENNKPRLLYHLKNRGYRGYSINRPDKAAHKLSKTEKELGGIPNSSEDVKQAHAAAIESNIEKFVGLDMEGTFRDPNDMGTMPFNRTLEDWAKFDINNRTKHDASISSGLAIMANQRHLYTPQKEKSKISINFARYDNTGETSQLKQ